MTDPRASNVLLICTVGSSPDPLVASLKHWRPARVCFLPSAETRASVGDRIVPLAAEEGVTISPGCHEVYVVPDAQDFQACVDMAAHRLAPEVEKWLERGDDYEVVVDFTAGTKCMTAGLALVARRWVCRFSYIGGEARTKDGVGIVLSGTEMVVHKPNPWDALGYQAVEDAVVLFDRGCYAAASSNLDDAMRSVTVSTIKRELSTLKSLASAYAAWDRFEHHRAYADLVNVRKSANDLHEMFGARTRDGLLRRIDRHIESLKAIKDARQPVMEILQDLLANAKRRADEGRFDDAVARLYRAVEALAQMRLREYGIDDTGKAPLDRLPEPCRSAWSKRAEDRLLRLGLQDAYALLHALGDALGARFRAIQWHDSESSPLVGRNQSILAHGFRPVSEKLFQQLWEGALELAGVTGDALPCFPKLAQGA